MAKPVLSDRTLERLVAVSAPMQTDRTAVSAIDKLSFEDFQDAQCRNVWQAVEAVVAERDGWINTKMVLDRAGMDQGEWAILGEGLSYLVASELISAVERVATMAGYRRASRAGTGIVEAVSAGDDLDGIVARAHDALEGVRSVIPEVAPPPTLADIMAKDVRHEYDWLVPDWLERLDRIILTGGEGFGKSALLRQFCVQIAAGFHPWTGEDFQPLRVMMLDLQDGEHRNDREFRMIANMAGVEPFRHLFVETRPQGLSIIKRPADRRWVEAKVKSCRPHVLIIGPVYRLALGSDRKEGETAQAICDFVDLLRNRYDVAVLLEAHQPNAPATGPRVTRPYGGQEFPAWADAGYGLLADGPNGAKLKPFRGNRDRLRKDWPERLVFGAEWPWVPRNAPVSVPALRARVVSRRVEVDEEPAPDDRDAPVQEELGGADPNEY